MTTPEQDRQLSRLLKEWPGPEPRPTFEQDVLRRIRLEVVPPSATGLWAWLPVWLNSRGRLAWATVVPLTVAFALGVASAWLPPSTGTDAATPLGSLSVLEHGTVAAGYVAMSEDR
jgi:hypothetical protein